MGTRSHVHEETFSVPPAEMFDILLRPSAICSWWGASRAIVLPEENGVWTAAWGDDEDHPDYISSFTIAEFDPPHSLHLTESRYYSKDGKLPFEAKMTARFTVEPDEGGCRLRVVQDGFPLDSVSDEFYQGCETGWKNTFAGIRKYFEER